MRRLSCFIQTRPHSRPAKRLRIERLESRAVPASVAGRVFLDFDNSGTANGPDTGMTGVTMTLSGGGLTTPLTQQTDAQGNFSFTGLAAGTYTLTETQPATPANQSGKTTAGAVGGSTATANTVSGIVLGASTSATGYTFAEVPLVSTGGTVFEDKNGNGIKDPSEPGVPNVTVGLTGTTVVNGPFTPKTATTDANGNYTFTGLVPGTYTLTETQPNGYFDGKEQAGTPAATTTNDKFAGIDLTKSAAVSSGFNFGEVKAGTISGVVFNDANNDGVQAATGEPGIAGVKVVLSGRASNGNAVARTVMTGADGSYSFSNLLGGSFTVQETQPIGYASGTNKVGNATGTVAGDRISNITLVAGTTATGYTFAEKAVADLVLTQTPSVANINPGGTVTLTFTIRNRGAAAATAATVLVNFGGLQFVSASNVAAFSSATKTWTVGNLATGATQTIRLTFRARTAGTYGPSARASTTATEPTTKNNASSSAISVGLPAPVSSPTPTFTFGGGFQSLLSAFNRYNILTRIWLFNMFFGH